MTVLDMSMSLDGYIADTRDDPTRVHEWLFNGDTPIDLQLTETVSAPGVTHLRYQVVR